MVMEGPCAMFEETDKKADPLESLPWGRKTCGSSASPGPLKTFAKGCVTYWPPVALRQLVTTESQASRELSATIHPLLVKLLTWGQGGRELSGTPSQGATWPAPVFPIKLARTLTLHPLIRSSGKGAWGYSMCTNSQGESRTPTVEVPAACAGTGVTSSGGLTRVPSL